MTFQLSVLLTALVSTSAFAVQGPVVALNTAQDLANWRPRAGDRLVVDTQENMGYLIHPNGQYAEFPVATGQRRVVRYIGMTYDATTPTMTWTVESNEIKGDRITFGPSGRFLRLYDEGEKTAYGIHEYAYETRMFEGDRFGSMGCIVVKAFMMDMLERTYAVNEGKIKVQTVYGLPGSGPVTL